MVRVTKAGVLNDYKEKEFKCIKCMCEFAADNRDYEIAKKQQFNEVYTVYVCKCPECGEQCYKADY